MALKQKALTAHGAAYPAWVLDQPGDRDRRWRTGWRWRPDLPAPRFRWVPYADALIFPLDNSVAKAANRDYDGVLPARREAAAALHDGVRRPRAAADARGLLPHRRHGRRSSGTRPAAPSRRNSRSRTCAGWTSGPAAEADAARIYARHVNGAPPPPQDYKTLQDYLFAYVAREAGRLGLAIHIHVANGGGANYDQRGSNPLLLTWAFNEPALRKTTFVIVHGGYPHYRETAGLISKPNVYADFSALSFFEGVHGQADLLRGWLSQWPEKILFGTDATPNTDETSWEETGWIASQTAREALAIALTGMIKDGEITRARASELARMVLRDNAQETLRALTCQRKVLQCTRCQMLWCLSPLRPSWSLCSRPWRRAAST